MKRAAALLLVALLSACHHKPPEKPTFTTDTVRSATEPVVPSEDTAPTGNVEVPTQALADAPPCLPVDPNTKISPRPRRTVVRTPPPPAPEPVVAPPAPVVEPSIKPIENLSASVLGKKVHSAQGDDMGRVVDVLADSSGRVRIAIIEFGGFLGVGLRRVAVDWSLLKFVPGSAETPVVLDVSRSKLQAAPEYKDSAHPLALMGPPTAGVTSTPLAPSAPSSTDATK